MREDIGKLWQLFLSGDSLAFEQIYALLLPTLYEFGMRRCADEALVKDALQDVFVKLWENRTKLNHVANPKHYLIVTLKNSIINVQLRDNKIIPLSEDNTFKLHFNLEHQILQREEERIRAQKLLDALDQLTAKQREVLYLRYFEGFSYEEIHEITHISVKSLYKINHRALESLKGILHISKADVILLFSFLRFLSS